MEQQEQAEIQLDNGNEILPSMMTTSSDSEDEVFFEGETFADDFLSSEEFFEGFKETFELASDLSKVKALKIDDTNSRELAGALATSNRLYAMARKYKRLHFLISKESGWLGDAALISLFCYQKGAVVCKEVAVKAKWAKLKAKVKGWVSLGRRGPVKPQKQESLSQI